MIYKCTIEDLYWLKDIMSKEQAIKILTIPGCHLYHVGNKSTIYFREMTPLMWEVHIHFGKNLRETIKDCRELKNIIFSETSCIKVICYLPDHKRSVINMCKNIGMEYEGTLKNSTVFEGKIIDQHIYSISKEN